ncbi:hypothetical protein [Maricaulis sp.]|uniref:hypothetical protein n=1 Tax=Maricaulis sp. TaxID=1486257 RepID=UPI0032972730
MIKRKYATLALITASLLSFGTASAYAGVVCRQTQVCSTTGGVQHCIYGVVCWEEQNQTIE